MLVQPLLAMESPRHSQQETPWILTLAPALATKPAFFSIKTQPVIRQIPLGQFLSGRLLFLSAATGTTSSCPRPERHLESGRPFWWEAATSQTPVSSASRLRCRNSRLWSAWSRRGAGREYFITRRDQSPTDVPHHVLVELLLLLVQMPCSCPLKSAKISLYSTQPQSVVTTYCRVLSCSVGERRMHVGTCKTDNRPKSIHSLTQAAKQTLPEPDEAE